ncbi:hypothetical protein Taro_054449 [Colocasia esculenta]|uniref:DYW domain-containing protein n=1 Tax=Colocasia esculenta TaxID=4460 RepID=A0A843XNV1_COLES|nr:hypothetical protein [Colocasia esculenta]
MMAMVATCCTHRHPYQPLHRITLAHRLRSDVPLHCSCPSSVRRHHPRHGLYPSANPAAVAASPSLRVYATVPVSSALSPAAAANNNHIIQCLCRQGNLRQAMKLLSLEANPTQRTYEALILSCARCRGNDASSFADTVHQRLVDDGYDQDPFLSTRLIEMYAEFGAVGDARQVFERTREKTVFVWNAMLRTLALAGAGEEALPLLREMVASGVSLDSFTYSFLLKACICVPSHFSLAFRRIREIHGHVFRYGFESQVHVATTLVDAYAKIGQVLYARRVFDWMPVKNAVSWSAMISCFTKNERSFEALQLFHKMMAEDTDQNHKSFPNSVTMVSVLQACGGLSALEQGKMVHAYILRRGLNSVPSVVNALIAMYMKCGNMESGRQMFDSISNQRDVVSWNSMISGYGIHGLGKEAIRVFQEMISAGIPPSPITFVSVLGACSHVGLVEDGKRLFNSMAREHGLVPSAEHYACMVDLLGRAGHLEEAGRIIEEMRIEPGPTVWGSLLGACRIHGHVELAERASSRLFQMEPKNAGNFVLLADIYAGAKMWEEVGRVKKLLEAQNLQKLPGCSWIEMKRNVYTFLSVDEMNPQIEQLHALILRLVMEMKETGYVPETNVVLYDLDQEEKERILLGHSEKLALAFGLINSGSGEVIRITKNLRLCEDCHAVTKFISKFAKREIFVRDVNRFHHFREGLCSCGDYW